MTDFSSGCANAGCDQQPMLHAQAMPWKDEIVAVGLARGIPNFKGEKHQHAEFKDVIERCRGLGWHITAHVGAPRVPCPPIPSVSPAAHYASIWLLQCVCPTCYAVRSPPFTDSLLAWFVAGHAAAVCPSLLAAAQTNRPA